MAFTRALRSRWPWQKPAVRRSDHVLRPLQAFVGGGYGITPSYAVASKFMVPSGSAPISNRTPCASGSSVL